MPIFEVPQPVAPIGTQITKLAFLKRFTNDEAINIDLQSIGATVGAATIRRYLQLVGASTYIDLARDDLREDLDKLEAAGLLAQGRANEIINTPINPIEVPLK